MFCKFCYDTGSSKEEYTSHYVQNIPGRWGVVVCPKLLAIECRYCKEKGHTISKCRKRIVSIKKEEFRPPPPLTPPPPPPSPIPTPYVRRTYRWSEEESDSD